MVSSLKLQNNNNSFNTLNFSSINVDKDEFAVLLVSHGSTLPYAKETFTDIRDKFISLTGIATEVGYMKVEQPTLPQAINILKKNATNNGNVLKHIIAMPVFLAPGIHTNIDIPIILGLSPKESDPRQPDGNYPEDHYLNSLEDIDFDGDITYLDPIGPDSNLLNFINKRINQSIEKSKLDKDSKTGIMLISHGSRLKYNYEFISSLFELFKNSTDFPCNFGFMELIKPDIPTSINKLVNENDIDRLIVVPVFIAPGVHTTHDIPTILGLIDDDGHSHSHDGHSHSHGDVKIDFDGEILYGEPIGSDDILINILGSKLKETINKIN